MSFGSISDSERRALKKEHLEIVNAPSSHKISKYSTT